MALPKRVAALLNDPRVESIEDERKGIGHPDANDGIWVYLKKGFRCADTETHAVHEWTVRELLESFKTVEPCTCEDCIEGSE